MQWKKTETVSFHALCLLYLHQTEEWAEQKMYFLFFNNCYLALAHNISWED